MSKRQWLFWGVLGIISLCGCDDASSSYKREFVLGCTQSGLPAAICNCTFDELDSKYGAQGWQRIQTQGPSEQTWIDMAYATKKCAQQYAAR